MLVNWRNEIIKYHRKTTPATAMGDLELVPLIRGPISGGRYAKMRPAMITLEGCGGALASLSNCARLDHLFQSCTYNVLPVAIIKNNLALPQANKYQSFRRWVYQGLLWRMWKSSDLVGVWTIWSPSYWKSPVIKFRTG